MNPSTVYCDNCGTANRPQTRFCIACGNVLPGTAFITPTSLLLKERYGILNRLDQGGMGTVYKAEDIQLGNRLVAVKEMSQSGLSPQEIIEAKDDFKREAYMLAGLQHPNLPNIYDHFFEGGRWYLVMSFIEGQTLAAYLNKAQGGRLSVEEVLNIGIQLCTVLGYLHQHQPPIIFRDLRPANVMRTSDGHLYLIDFGIARHFKPGQVKDTIAFGSLGYAAPEQYGNTQTTPRADIYSLGVLLHQLLSGHDPLANTPNTFTFPPLHLQGQPAMLEELIMQMVQVEEQNRPASVVVVRQELRRLQTQLKQPPLPAVSQKYLPVPQPLELSNPPLPLVIPVPPPPSQSLRRGNPILDILQKLKPKTSRTDKGENRQTKTLSLFATARATLERDERAFVGKYYTVQVGVARSKPENFSSEPFDLPVRNVAEPIWFDILLHTSENVEIARDWHNRLRYDPRNPEPQLITFMFRLVAPGHSSLAINFYRERRWLKTIRIEFDTIEQSQPTAVSFKGG